MIFKNIIAAFFVLALTSSCSGGLNQGGYMASMDKVKYNPIKEKRRRPIYNEQLLNKQRSMQGPVMINSANSGSVQNNIWFDKQLVSPASKASPLNVPPLNDPNSYAPNVQQRTYQQSNLQAGSPVYPQGVAPNNYRAPAGINAPANAGYKPSLQAPIPQAPVRAPVPNVRPAPLAPVINQQVSAPSLSKNEIMMLAEKEKNPAANISRSYTLNPSQKITMPVIGFEQATPAALR